MKWNFPDIRKLFFLQAKFLSASVAATAFDYVLFLLLTHAGYDAVIAHATSYPLAVLLNFYLQKQFVFKLERKLRISFAMAMGFSALGWGLGTALMYLLVKIPVLATIPILAKLIVTFMLFFYNFFAKRYAFEKRLY